MVVEGEGRVTEVGASHGVIRHQYNPPCAGPSN
jgi:hypothetical protein